MSICAILLLVFSFAGLSQTSPTEKEKYDAGMNAAREKMKGIPLRKKAVEQEYLNKVVTATCNVINEYISTDAYRIVRSSATPNPRCNYQYVRVGGYDYTKNARADWSKSTVGDNGATQGGTDKWGSVDTKSLHEYVITSGELNGQKVTIYLHCEVFEINGQLIFVLDQHWVNTEGYLVRTYTRVSSILPENIDRDTTYTYEYNPKDIKIEAPIK